MLRSWDNSGISKIRDQRAVLGVKGTGWENERDGREARAGIAVQGSEVSEAGVGEGGSNVKSTAQSCRRGAILRAKGRRLPDVWKGSRAIIEGKKGLCGFIGAAPPR